RKRKEKSAGLLAVIGLGESFRGGVPPGGDQRLSDRRLVGRGQFDAGAAAASHAPLNGWNAPGSLRTNIPCPSGVSLSPPQSSSGPSVAKILPRTRKSAWPPCAPSTASGRLSARFRNSSAVMVVDSTDPEPLGDHNSVVR